MTTAPEAKFPISIWRKYYGRVRGVIATAGELSIREEQVFLLLAIIIGLFSGLLVVLFRLLIETLRIMLLGSALRPSFPRVVIVPALAGLVIAVLVIKVFPKIRGSGVNQTKGALYIYDGYIASSTVIGKFFVSALAIGSGQSLGPEDPSLQIGAGVASFLGRKLKLTRERLRLIAPVGAAAGLAAAFNAPITAVLFVIEEVIGRWSAGILGAIVLSAISSVVVERWFLGDTPLFRIPSYHLVHPAELLAYAAMGVIGGFASLVFVKVVSYLRPKLRTLPHWTQYFQPAAAGLIIGLIGVRYPQVMGAGYEYMDQAMHGRFTWQFLAILAGLKILSTALSFASGTPGGLFAPVLFIGAMIGGSVGMSAQTFFPHLTIPAGAYALVGMGTLFAGILRAPMTSVFMIMEVSGNYSIILPVIISNTIAYLISRSFQPVPIFDILSRQDGLDLPSLEEEREVGILRVEDAMRPAPIRALRSEEPLYSARAVVRNAPDTELLLVSFPDGRWGAITAETLMGLTVDETTPLGDYVTIHLPLLYPDQALDAALRQIKDWPLLPVIHRADLRRLVGIISLKDIIAAYHDTGTVLHEE